MQYLSGKLTENYAAPVSASLFGSQGRISQKMCAPKAGHIHLAHLSALIGDSGKGIHQPDRLCLTVYTAGGKIFPLLSMHREPVGCVYFCVQLNIMLA